MAPMSRKSTRALLTAQTIAMALMALMAAGAAACSDDGGGDDPDDVIVQKADNGVSRCGKPAVYLNFGPVKIRKGRADDSKQDIADAPALPDEGLDIPLYPNSGDRDRLIQLIDEQLAEQQVPVVHTRPPEGDYFMLVFVDKFLQGVQGGRTATNCGHANPNTIGFVNTEFFSLAGGIEYSVHGAMLMLGRSVGADPVAVAVARNNCMVNDAFLPSCSFGKVTRTSGPCAGGAQDQLALLSALSCK